MENQSNTTDESAAANNRNRTMRLVWTILTAVFALIVLWRLYDWSNGRENLRGILSPMGMIFVGLGALIRPRNRNLSFVFTGIALILVFTGLALMLIY